MGNSLPPLSGVITEYWYSMSSDKGQNHCQGRGELSATCKVVMINFLYCTAVIGWKQGI